MIIIDERKLSKMQNKSITKSNVEKKSSSSCYKLAAFYLFMFALGYVIMFIAI